MDWTGANTRQPGLPVDPRYFPIDDILVLDAKLTPSGAMTNEAEN